MRAPALVVRLAEEEKTNRAAQKANREKAEQARLFFCLVLGACCSLFRCLLLAAARCILLFLTLC